MKKNTTVEFHFYLDEDGEQETKGKRKKTTIIRMINYTGAYDDGHASYDAHNGADDAQTRLKARRARRGKTIHSGIQGGSVWNRIVVGREPGRADCKYSTIDPWEGKR